MKRSLFLLVICLHAIIHDTRGQVTSVLWLGNSYIATNNLPVLFYQLALSGGDTIQYDSNTPGGYTLEDHWNSLTTQNKINQQPWDYVIIQAQSQEPSLDSAFVTNWVLPYAEGLDSLVHLNDSCSQTVFYMTWGRKNGDAQNCPTHPEVCTYQGMQNQLRNRYLQMGYDNNAMVAPCGEAWRDVIAASPAFDLYMADESHPSLHGSYLNACVFYASIFRRSPVGLTYYGGLPVADAQFLQQYAASCVLDSMSVWNTEIYYDDPSFSYTTVSGNTISFNAAVTTTNHQWDFGQGYGTGTASIMHTFSGPGAYYVGHVTENGCHTDTSYEWVLVGPAGVGENTALHFTLLRNAGTMTCVMGAPVQDAVAEITDMQGRVIKQIPFTGPQLEISTSDMANGIYVLRITAGHQTSATKFEVAD